MRSIYSAAHGADAQIVADVLRAEGVDAHVFGAGLIGGAGELPAIGVVDVRVADRDVARALAVIADWNAGRYAEEDMVSPVSGSTGSTDATRTVPAAASPALIVLVGFALGAILAGGGVYLALRPPPEALEYDYDGDGVADEALVYRGDHLTRIEYDRNADRVPDAVMEMGEPGVWTYRSDDDFDGRLETVWKFRRSQPYLAESDYDGDGKFEWRLTFRHGVLALETYVDASTGLPSVLRRQIDGRLHESDIDIDRDGEFDLRRRHDERGEIVSSTAITQAESEHAE